MPVFAPELVQAYSLLDVCCPECRLQALRAYLSGDNVKAEAAAAVQASRKADQEELAANVSPPYLSIALPEAHGIICRGATLWPTKHAVSFVFTLMIDTVEARLGKQEPDQQA